MTTPTREKKEAKKAHNRITNEETEEIKLLTKKRHRRTQINHAVHESSKTVEDIWRHSTHTEHVY